MGVLDYLFPPSVIPEAEETDEVESRNAPTTEISISDPAFAEYLGIGSVRGGLNVTENTALGIPAYYRAVSIVAGTIAGLPLKTYTRTENDGKERVSSFLDNPAGPYRLTPFAWKELVMLHLLNKGEAFLLHVYNGAGALIGLFPVHPSAVTKVEWVGADKLFTVHMADNSTKVFTSNEMTHIMGMTLDGLRGLAPITLFRNALKIGLAGDTAALRTFTNGLLLGGLVTPDEDLEPEEAEKIKAGLMARLSGVENAGDIAVINRKLKFSPWAMSMEDAQFLESREFQVVEFARMIGVPPHLVGATEKQTSWGTGVAEQNLGLSRFTLMPWTSRIQEALSELLTGFRFCEFDYHQLLQASPQEEIRLLIEQVNAGLLTKDEARAIMNRPPLGNIQLPREGENEDE